MDEKVTVLINSCDSYEDLWGPFFKLFKTYWPQCNYRLLLNTESKNFVFSGLNIDTLNLYEYGDLIPWGERIINHLKDIETEYTLILLDDFFIRRDVNSSIIEKCIKWMDDDNDIAMFSFERGTKPENIKSTVYEGFEKRPQKGKYKFNLQAGIWRTEELITYIKPYENPWEWEVYGNLRSWKLRKDFYCLASDSVNEVIDYGYNKEGMGVFRGKWVYEDVKPLFDKHEIEMDYKLRGIYKKNNIKQKSIKSVVISYLPVHLIKYIHYVRRFFRTLIRGKSQIKL